MEESRPVRYELTMEEASLLVDLLREHLGSKGDDELATALLARLQRAEDLVVNTPVRGPSNDGAEYEW